MRTNVYIDGFNLYFGCLKDTPYRWLDLRAMCEQLLPQHEVHRIRYFTANVVARPHNPSQPVRQETYLRAIQTLPGVSVHLGHYLCRPTRMQLANPPPGGPATVEVIKSEEKGTDVNIATYLLLDGFEKDYEQAVVISNDSDLKTPIELVRQRLGYPVGVVFPISRTRRHPSQVLLPAATFTRELRTKLLRSAQLPPVVQIPPSGPQSSGSAAGQIHKPATW